MAKPKNSSHPVITIDGPAASGKTSVSRGLAERLGWSWVSTGAFYRGLAFVALERKMNLDDEEKLVGLARSGDWFVELGKEKTRFFYKGEEVTEQIYEGRVGAVASQISQWPKVRERLLSAQRDCAQKVKGLVAEGRDCGTVVFPAATAKFFLTATSESRAERRAQELGDDFQKIHSDQEKRDERDSQRKTAPMQKAEDAVIIDSSDFSLDEVIESLLKHLKGKVFL